MATVTREVRRMTAQVRCAELCVCPGRQAAGQSAKPGEVARVLVDEWCCHSVSSVYPRADAFTRAPAPTACTSGFANLSELQMVATLDYRNGKTCENKGSIKKEQS
jgi:hypothetical protein